MFFASRSIKTFLPEEGVPDGAHVPRTYAKQLVEQYKNLHHDHLLGHGQIGFNTVYVSLHMEQLIESLQSMYNSGAGSDICRIYFGAHDASETIDGYDVSNKMTLIFVGAKMVDGCIVERFNNTDMPGLDFGTLCPPQCKSCCEVDNSLSAEVFGSGPCDESTPETLSAAVPQSD